jgi:hypothetical protein
LTTGKGSGALLSWNYGGCCQSPRNGVVRYFPVAVRKAYAGSMLQVARTLAATTPS